MGRIRGSFAGRDKKLIFPVDKSLSDCYILHVDEDVTRVPLEAMALVASFFVKQGGFLKCSVLDS